MLPPRLAESEQGVEVAKVLGARFVRPQAVLTAQPEPSCPTCGRFQRAGFELVLTVRHTHQPREPAHPPTDLGSYRRTVEAVVTRYRPALLVVENEENSASLFYAGSPEEYASQLQVACRAAHAHGVRCTNGGLVSRLTALLTYFHYRDLGQLGRAEDFARRVFPGPERRLVDSGQAAVQVDRGRRLLRSYRAAGADFVNFHWYESDPEALREVVDSLRSQTGLPAVSNEMGQRTDDPAQTVAVMEQVVKSGLPVAVWFAMDGPQARGLVDPTGRLRATGLAFQGFVRKHFPSPRP